MTKLKQTFLNISTHADTHTVCFNLLLRKRKGVVFFFFAASCFLFRGKEKHVLSRLLFFFHLSNNIKHWPSIKDLGSIPSREQQVTLVRVKIKCWFLATCNLSQWTGFTYWQANTGTQSVGPNSVRQAGRLTSSSPPALRWPLRQLLVEWSFGCRRHHSCRLLHPCRWRALAAEVWRWTLVDPPDPAGCGHHNNRRHRGAPWNRDDGWREFSHTACDLKTVPLWFRPLDANMSSVNMQRCYWTGNAIGLAINTSINETEETDCSLQQSGSEEARTVSKMTCIWSVTNNFSIFFFFNPNIIVSELSVPKQTNKSPLHMWPFY